MTFFLVILQAMDKLELPEEYAKPLLKFVFIKSRTLFLSITLNYSSFGLWSTPDVIYFIL